MEGVIREVTLYLYARTNAHIPLRVRPPQHARRQTFIALRQIIDPIKEQLREDTKWKK